MNIAYFGYDIFFNCLKSIIDSNHNVKYIYTTNFEISYYSNSCLLKIAEESKTPVYFHKPNEDDIHKINTDCDLIIVAGYPLKIQTSNLSVKAINIHPTLLPYGRGPWPFPDIIYYKHKISGVTIHKLSEEFDSGDILTQNKFELSDQENLESLICKSHMCAITTLKELMGNFNYYWKNSKTQDSYKKKPTEKYRTIDFNQDVETVNLIIRAFGKLNCFIFFDEKKWLVKHGLAWKENHKLDLGEIVLRSKEEIVFSISGGYLCITEFEMHLSCRTKKSDRYMPIFTKKKHIL